MYFNPLSPATIQDPYPLYAELREHDPVHRSRLMGGWVLSRHEDIDRILRDHRRFSNDFALGNLSLNQRSFLQSPEESSILTMDQPEHTRLRTLAGKAFSRALLKSMEPRIRRTANMLLDDIRDLEGFDLIESFAIPLPIMVIAEMLGVPPENLTRFRIWSHRSAHFMRLLLAEGILQRFWFREPESQGKTLENVRIDPLVQAGANVRSLDQALREVIESRREEAGDDAVSALLHAEDHGDRLKGNEILNLLRVLVEAGSGTTTGLIGNGTLALLQHPEQLAVLRRNPSHLPRAVEEMLRFDSPMMTDYRVARVDCIVGSRSLKQGDILFLLIGSANRDPDIFDRPESFDISRTKNLHLSFGRGVHHCIGVSLARLIAGIAFETLLERFPTIRLLDDRPAFQASLTLRSVACLRCIAAHNPD